MIASEARIAANRANAQRSKGPVTTEGKERSRANGLKHGMAGRGVVIPEDDLGEIERRVEALEADLNPQSALGVILIRKMALFSVRLERGARQESAALNYRVRHAADDFDEARIDQADRTFDALADDPRGNLRKLRKSPEGVDRLALAWQDLRADLARDGRPTWTASHLEQAANLTGLRVDHARNSRIGALSRAVWGDFEALADGEGSHLEEDARKSWARTKLLDRIDAEVGALEIHRDTLDFEMIELDRSEAGARALFDPSKEATLARRYESEAHRGFFKALKEFRQAEAEFAARAEAEAAAPPPPPEVVAPAESLGSSRDEESPTMGSSRDEESPGYLDLAREFLNRPLEAPVVRSADGRPLRITRPAPTTG